MIEFKDNILTIRVELEPGIYFFEPNSATGKTRLYHHMCDMYNDGGAGAAYNILTRYAYSSAQHCKPSAV